MARPTIYSEEIVNESWSYIGYCNDVHKGDKTEVRLPTIEGLALHLEISRSTLYLWQKEHQEFSDIIETLLQKQAQTLVNNGLQGTYNPTIAKVLLTKHGYTDKQEVKTTIQDKRRDLSKLSDDDLETLERIYNKIGESPEEV